MSQSRRQPPQHRTPGQLPELPPEPEPEPEPAPDYGAQPGQGATHPPLAKIAPNVQPERWDPPPEHGDAA